MILLMFPCPLPIAHCTLILTCYYVQVLVAEPSPVDTVNILRGIKEKYESFHGVRIADRALVVAAELSHRYIQHRFLPDKVGPCFEQLVIRQVFVHALRRG